MPPSRSIRSDSERERQASEPTRPRRSSKPKGPPKQRKIPKHLLECGVPFLHYGVKLADIQTATPRVMLPLAGPPSNGPLTDTPSSAPDSVPAPPLLDPIQVPASAPVPMYLANAAADAPYLPNPNAFPPLSVPPYNLELSRQMDYLSMANNMEQSYSGYISNYQQASNLMFPPNFNFSMGYDGHSPQYQYPFPSSSSAQLTTMPAAYNEMFYHIETDDGTDLLPGRNDDAMDDIYRYFPDRLS